ncbi:hypothetical protein T484DRAFT_1775378 [Baffinella frigidus]|nr:hypothetical protein T484DRAFT_1775378 [Cryptophyta sp. CCMP2293]
MEGSPSSDIPMAPLPQPAGIGVSGMMFWVVLLGLAAAGVWHVVQLCTTQKTVRTRRRPREAGTPARGAGTQADEPAKSPPRPHEWDGVVDDVDMSGLVYRGAGRGRPSSGHEQRFQPRTAGRDAGPASPGGLSGDRERYLGGGADMASPAYAASRFANALTPPRWAIPVHLQTTPRPEPRGGHVRGNSGSFGELAHSPILPPQPRSAGRHPEWVRSASFDTLD